MQTVTVTGLTIYPVKSLKGISLQQAELTAQGLAMDRRWMLINAQQQFITQRQQPRMALISTALTEEGLVLSMPGMGECLVDGSQRQSHRLASKVWQDDCQVISEGEDVSAWLSEALQSTGAIQLVTMADGFRRQHEKADLMAQHYSYFADAAPFLVANQQSLDALNQQLQAAGEGPVGMDRFRPNIVIKGLPAFSEHQTKQLKHPNYTITHCYPCERCIITTIDQKSAIKNPRLEPFNSLKGINSLEGAGKKPVFGENAVLAEGGGLIRLGDELFCE